jgi:hypothetical protein
MLRKVRGVDFRIQNDIPQAGEECVVSFSVEGGPSVGRTMNLARASAIMQAAGHADTVAFDDATGALHLLFKAPPVRPFQPFGE